MINQSNGSAGIKRGLYAVLGGTYSGEFLEERLQSTVKGFESTRGNAREAELPLVVVNTVMATVWDDEGVTRHGQQAVVELICVEAAQAGGELGKQCIRGVNLFFRRLHVRSQEHAQVARASDIIRKRPIIVSNPGPEPPKKRPRRRFDPPPPPPRFDGSICHAATSR